MQKMKDEDDEDERFFRLMPLDERIMKQICSKMSKFVEKAEHLDFLPDLCRNSISGLVPSIHSCRMKNSIQSSMHAQLQALKTVFRGDRHPRVHVAQVARWVPEEEGYF